MDLSYLEGHVLRKEDQYRLNKNKEELFEAQSS